MSLQQNYISRISAARDLDVMNNSECYNIQDSYSKLLYCCKSLQIKFRYKHLSNEHLFLVSFSLYFLLSGFLLNNNGIQILYLLYLQFSPALNGSTISSIIVYKSLFFTLLSYIVNT